MKVVALLAVRDEAEYLRRCLEHLIQQGVYVCLIDNDSTDGSLAIAEAFFGKGVIGIERLPYKGYFDLVEQLQCKERLSREVEADWFIHVDADEIREPHAPFATLRDGIIEVDRQGYNAINFDEFVFLPTSDAESFEGTDYVRMMKYYYFFMPNNLHRVNAWKSACGPVDLTSTGGHQVDFEGRMIYPENFVLRHYIGLSARHLINKYTSKRIYSRAEIDERRWHGARARFSEDKLRLSSIHSLKCISGLGWDKSDPWLRHKFLGED
jgi:glycosyltransferase involved in cell wall biosynthesis